MPAHTLQHLPLTDGSGIRSAGLWKRFWNLLSRGVAGIGAGYFSMQLGAGQEVRLHDAADWTVACRTGSVWITQEADARDIFLGAGESFTLDRAGMALILARRTAALAIRPPVRERSLSAESSGQGACPVPAPDSARELWLKALYPECGPWNDPAEYRRSGLL